MKPLLTVIETPQGINDLREYLKDFEYIAYDCETTGLSRRDEVIGFSVCAEETKAFYVVLSKWDFPQTPEGVRTEREMVYYPENKAASLPLLEDLKSKQLIMHNAIFDCIMAEAFFKVSLIHSVHTDTMVLAHLLDENRSYALKELGREMYGADADKEKKVMNASIIANGGSVTKDKYELYKADAKLIGEYGAKDTILTYKLFTDLVPQLYEQGLDAFFYEDEAMLLLRTSTYELNNTGLQIDTNALTTLKKQLEADCIEAKTFILSEIAPHVKDKYPGLKKKDHFNIGSSNQLAWLLFGVLGLQFNTLTKGGKELCKKLSMKPPYHPGAKKDFIAMCLQRKDEIYEQETKTSTKTVRAKKIKDPWTYIQVDNKTLAKYADKLKWVKRLLEYKKNLKLLDTYVCGIEAGVNYGVIQPSFLQTGTTSGRYSSKSPNFQNLPRKDKRIKSCVVSRPGKAFVGADFSQLEPRVFAYMSQDERLMEAFADASTDFYSVIGMSVNDIFDALPQKEGHPDAFGIKYSKLRDDAKVIALASAYGSTAFQLAPTTGKSIEETEEIIEKYFERFPKVLQMMLDSHAQAKAKGAVTSLYGRPRRIPEATSINKIYGDVPHAQLPYIARNILNLSMNHRIQSTAASIVNRAAIKFYHLCEDAGIKAPVVLQVHDQLVAECSTADSENVALLLQEAMENAVTLLGIRLEAVPKIGHKLSEL